MPPSEALVTEWVRCRASFRYYLSRYGRVREVVQVGKRSRERAVGFQMWPHIEEMAALWEAGGHVMLGKGRQSGASWLLVNYDSWRMTFFGEFNILSISIGQRESGKLLEKVRYCLDRQPDWMRLQRTKDNESEITLSNGSSIQALPSTENAGRSETASLVQTDEFAFHRFAGANFSAYRPAIADGGQHLIITTGNGPTGMFHDWWTNDSAEFEYEKVFWPWHVRPDRDEEWYERERRAFLSSGDRSVSMFIRENPATVEEMFTAVVGLAYPEFSPKTHMREPAVRYEDCQFRVAAIDPGQGDPAAVAVLGASNVEEGVDEDGSPIVVQRSHVYGPSFYDRGTVTAQQFYAHLKRWYQRAPLHAVLVDDPPGTLIATLNAWFLRDFGREPVQMANKDRQIGIGLVAGRVREGWLTVDPGERDLQREFQSYQFSTRRAAGEADPYTTSTPVDHHGDLLDCIRYALMWLATHGRARVAEVAAPVYPARPAQSTALPAPVYGAPLADTATPRTTVRGGSRLGPDYRMRVALRAGRRR